ncbi:MAG: IS3 family transposase [Ruminococcus sp.]|nr:IS3 family transposase [Ruminococcus sp.]
MRQYWTSPETAKGCRRRSVGREPAAKGRACIPKKIASLSFGKGATQQEKVTAIQELRREYPLAMLLEIAQLPRATFYYHLKQRKNPDKYASAKEEITAIYHENKGRYGYRRITTELRKRNILLNHKTVQRLMKEMGIVCRVRIKKYRSYKGEVGKIAPNLLGRNFHADRPNQKWVTDVTEFHLFGEKLYLSPILDLHSRDIVSYVISERPVLSMVTTMLEKAFAKLSNSEILLLHSDQGWQYQHKHYQRMLQEKGIQQSMSNKGNCLDNAVMENFFGLLKSELLYLQEFESMDHFKQELVEYLDYYNNRRIKTKLKGLPPALHRQQALLAA